MDETSTANINHTEVATTNRDQWSVVRRIAETNLRSLVGKKKKTTAITTTTTTLIITFTTIAITITTTATATTTAATTATAITTGTAGRAKCLPNIPTTTRKFKTVMWPFKSFLNTVAALLPYFFCLYVPVSLSLLVSSNILQPSTVSKLVPLSQRFLHIHFLPLPTSSF